MKKIIFMAFGMLWWGCLLQAQVALLPMPRENLYDYIRRMDAYYAPLLAVNGSAMVREEGSEYNEYQKFLQYWEPRLHPHGDFEQYFQREADFFLGKKSGTRQVGNLDPWQEIGPIEKPVSNVGAEGTGPTEFITFSPSAPSRMLCGSNAGGLFYSTNSGVSWKMAGTDNLIGRSGVGTAVFHPGDYRTWFAASAANSGSGEPLWIGPTGGIFRTTDEGASWTMVANESQVGGIWSRLMKLVINPANANQLWVATTNGVFVTNNALAATPTWTSIAALNGKILYDVEVRTNDPNWLYVTFADNYDANGNPVNWHYQYSSNNGSTWQDFPNLPSGVLGAKKLTIEVTRADVDNVYCLLVPFSGSSSLFIMDFPSTIWTLVTSSASISFGGGHGFGVDPLDPNEIFLTHGSEGRRYNYLPPTTFITYNSTYYAGGTYHPDIEDLVPHPLNGNEVWMCHHGGVSQSTDNGATWQDRTNGIGVAQTYRMYESATDPGYVSLGLYHDGTIVTNSAWYNPWSPLWRQYQSAYCDGMRPLIDHQDARYQWHSCQWGTWYFSSDFGVNFAVNGPSSPSWIEEAAMNKLDSRIQYRVSTVAGKHEIKRTFDRFTSHDVISDFDAIITGPGVDHYILWKVFTPETNGDYLAVHLRVYYTGGGEDDMLFRTKFANDPNPLNVVASWEECPLPRNSWLSEVEFDHDNPDHMFVGYSSSSTTTSSPVGTEMVYWMDYTVPSSIPAYTCPSGLCEDFTQNLPNASVGQDALALERGSNGGLYIVTDYGCWHSNHASRAAGNGWNKLGTGLPYTGYNGLMINYVANKIRAGAFGRGAWEHDLYCPSDDNYTETITYGTDTYLEANDWISSTATVPNGIRVTYRAGEWIDLRPGFVAKPGSYFHAFIHPCDRPYGNGPFKQRPSEGAENTIGELDATPVQSPEGDQLWQSQIDAKVYPNPNEGQFTVFVMGLKPDELWNFEIWDVNGKKVAAQTQLSGPVVLQMPDNATKGLYLVKILARDQQLVKKVWVQ